MVLPASADHVQELMDNVRQCLFREQDLALALANAKADTGETLVELEAALGSQGLKRHDMLKALEELAVSEQFEVLDDETIRNRKRMARLRRDHPNYASSLLTLGVSQQKSLSNLSNDRIGEFVACGIPLPGGASVPLDKATKHQTADAVRAAWQTDPGKPVEIPALDTPSARKPSFLDVLKAIKKLPALTLEQLEDLLIVLATLVVFDPKITSRATRRMIEATFTVGYDLEKVPVNEAVKVLQALPQYLANVDFGHLTESEARAIACSMLAPVLAALGEWCPPARATG